MTHPTVRLHAATESVAVPSQILTSLVEATRANPMGRKLLVSPDLNHARELLVALARVIDGWIGWEATSLRAIADDLAFVPLARQGLRTAGDVTIGCLISEAIRTCAEAGRLGGNFARLERSLGFRSAVRDSVLELRVAGVTGREVQDRSPAGSTSRDVGAVLLAYEQLLSDRHLADPATVFQLAFEHFDDQAPFTLSSDVWVVPARVAGGLPAALANRLREFGARELKTDASISDAELRINASTVDVFCAATPADELREVFRRIAAEGRRFDDVEIVATDVDTYGVALDVLCAHIGAQASMLSGVPLIRTRLGRALERWFAWLSDGLPADVLRQSLEAGEIGAGVEPRELPASALARELRRLRVGWGRERYERAVLALHETEQKPDVSPFEDEDDEAFAARRESRQRGARNLRALLTALLATTPAVPERGNGDRIETTVAALARCTLGWLTLVITHGEAEAQTASRLANRLEQLAESNAPTTSFADALAELQSELADLRAWPTATHERKPWSSSGGMVHLTDLTHAGTTGRPRVFIVGLDAERTAGGGRQDPLLSDAVRARIAPDRLLSSAERRRQREWQAVAALNGVRGSVTLSYSTSGNLDGRESGPSPLLLEAWRQSQQDPRLTFEKLREYVRPLACAVPAKAGSTEDAVAIDGRDVWLDALNDGATLLDGTAVIRAAFTTLDAGLRALDARTAPDASAHHGIAAGAAGKLDPCAEPDRAISPSSLEKLATCPLAWFYRYGVGLRAPEDPEYDPERWLDALQRGSLLHEVYEQFTRRYQGRQPEIASDDALTSLGVIVDAALERWRADAPPPGQAAFDSEAAELRRAATVFLMGERERITSGDGGRWRSFELKFGRGAQTATYEISAGRQVSLHGRVDRVDDLVDGSLRVVDYKTGSNYQFRRRANTPAFNGGRQLQAALYASACTTIVGAPVSCFEYHFPTEKGGGEIVRYHAGELQAAREVVGRLLWHVETGAFVPTDDANDCKYCEYAPICRVTEGQHAVSSPRAAWAKEHGPNIDAYAVLRELRGSSAGEGAGDE